MAKFVIEQGFWELFPETEIGVVTAYRVDNKLMGQEDVLEEISTILEGSNWEAKKHFTEEVFSENPVIAVWRQAYQKFKTKKGVRCSIEALLKRVEKGNPVSSINPLVDIYNAVSLTYGIPCGGEDMDSFQGDLVLTIAQGGESFMALGDEEEDPALPGEVIYRDDLGAVCRCWNWRDGQRTMLTPDTTRAFLIIESVDPTRKKAFQEATEQLADWIHRYTGAEVEITYLHQTNREMEL